MGVIVKVLQQGLKVVDVLEQPGFGKLAAFHFAEAGAWVGYAFHPKLLDADTLFLSFFFAEYFYF